MCVQLLSLRHQLYGMTNMPDTFCSQMLEGNLTAVAVQIDTIVSSGVAVGRQCVVRTAGIVAGTLTGIRSQEDATGIDYPLSQQLVVLHLHNQVFRSIGVGEGHHLINRTDEHVAAVFQRLSSYLLTWQQSQLTFHLSLHLVELVTAGGDEEHLRVDAVLCLRQQVGSHKLSIGCLVSQHADLRGSCRHVDSHFIEADLLLGCHHILVARTENLIDLGHRLRTVSHSTDGLHTASLENLAHASNAGSHQNGGIDLSLFIRRCTQYDFLTSGYLGRCGQHQDGREEWGSAAGNVESDALDGHTFLPADHTFLCLHLLSDEAL